MLGNRDDPDSRDRAELFHVVQYRYTVDSRVVEFDYLCCLITVQRISEADSCR